MHASTARQAERNVRSWHGSPPERPMSPSAAGLQDLAGVFLTFTEDMHPAELRTHCSGSGRPRPGCTRAQCRSLSRAGAAPGSPAPRHPARSTPRRALRLARRDHGPSAVAARGSPAPHHPARSAPRPALRPVQCAAFADAGHVGLTWGPRERCRLTRPASSQAQRGQARAPARQRALVPGDRRSLTLTGPQEPLALRRPVSPQPLQGRARAPGRPLGEAPGEKGLMRGPVRGSVTSQARPDQARAPARLPGPVPAEMGWERGRQLRSPLTRCVSPQPQQGQVRAPALLRRPRSCHPLPRPVSAAVMS